MGLAYGIRGGDILNIDEINNYIATLERIHNCNIVANTIFFNDYVNNNDFRSEFYFRGGVLSLISVYIIPDSVTTPTTYPIITTFKNLESNSNITATAIQSETTTQNFTFEGENYKACFLKRTYSLASSGYYARLSFGPVGGSKSLQNTNLSQIIVIQEPSTALTLSRIIEGETGAYADFALSGVQDYSSFSMCVLDKDNNVFKQNYVVGTTIAEAFPISSFFLCSNFSYDYVANMKFLFKYYASGTNSFYIVTRNQDFVAASQREKYTKRIDLTETSTSFSTTYKEYEITYPQKFINALKNAVKNADSNDKIYIQIVNVDAEVTIVDYIRCVKVNNQIFSYIPIAATYPLSTATLFPLKQNARIPHSIELFEGNVGADLKTNTITNFDNKLIASFVNGLHYTDFIYQYDLSLYNDYVLKFGIGQY